jgi:hypothetical protein
MREIKFRVWNYADQKMYKVCAMHLFLDWGGWGYEVEVNGRDSFLVPANAESKYDAGILGEFTGLKDKNGKEIYEGDIDRRGIVMWRNGCWHIVNENGQTFDYLFMCENIEIIGNIHENPELLK